MTAAGRQPVRWPALAAAVLSGAVFGLWLSVILVQEDVGRDEAVRHLFVGAMLFALPALAVAGASSTAPTARLVLLAAAASGMLAWGILAIFSVGLLLLIASVLAWIAVVSAARAGGNRVSAALAAVGVFVLTLGYLATI